MTIGIGIAIVIIAVWAGRMVWQRQRGKTVTSPIPTDVIAPEALAQQAFIRGNTYLFNGELEEAIAAFQQALELDPNHPHAAKRLAEAEQSPQAQAKANSTIAA